MKKNRFISIRNENTAKFLGLALHIVAMHDDAYLAGHPEWHELVKEARKALKSEDLANVATNQ